MNPQPGHANTHKNSYEMFRKVRKELNKIKHSVLVCDEGHRLKSSAGTKTMRARLANSRVALKIALNAYG